MPTEIAATLSRSTLSFTMLRFFIQPMQSANATQAPVIDAVRVPPSACSTSQSTVIWRSPNASRSRVARSDRPISRWISTVRPFCLPAEASRRVRSSVARGSMPYSAVTQPRPCPLSQGGSRSSSVAVTRTWVSPNLTRQEPSAYLTTPRSSETAHTSAGRLPTELGLRFFVDALMQVGDLTEAERQSIQSQLTSVGRAQSVEAVLGEALTRLSGLTRAAAVVLTAKSNSRLKHIEFVRLEPERALVVLVAEDGQVENRVLTLLPGVPSSALTEATNFLNARIRGRTLAEARLELETALTQSRVELDQLTQKVIAAGIASWSGGDNDDRQLIVRGHANLLEDLHAI